ncbi:MAG TPA: hypothetical protein EYP78_00440 [Candidatus Omnitrophica bacterium]|nr:hypothetical protein [Candidatus Omnitrophota bacterium]
MTSRERILKTLKHDEPDRVPIHDTPWSSTVHRWHKEGLSQDIPVNEYFDYEMVGISCDCSPRYPVEVLEKNENYITTREATGAINRNRRDYASTPELVDRPIKSKKDWPPIKERLFPDYTRVDWVSAFNNYHRAKSEGKFIYYGSVIGYDALQGYMKSDQLLITMVEDPDWVKDMIMTLAKLRLEMMKMMIDKGIKFDGAFFSNDMGYRNGLLFSPEIYRKTHKEADEMLFSFSHKHNMPVILHSCGCVKELIPELIEAGVDCLQPLEVKAGMDLIKLKGLYGEKLAFMGGIDVRAMADPDTKVIEEEIKKKFEVAKKGGGYIYHSDHSVPNNVSFNQYKRVIELVRKYGEY